MAHLAHQDYHRLCEERENKNTPAAIGFGVAFACDLVSWLGLVVQYDATRLVVQYHATHLVWCGLVFLRLVFCCASCGVWPAPVLHEGGRE